MTPRESMIKENLTIMELGMICIWWALAYYWFFWWFSRLLFKDSNGYSVGVHIQWYPGISSHKAREIIGPEGRYNRQVFHEWVAMWSTSHSVWGGWTKDFCTLGFFLFLSFWRMWYALYSTEGVRKGGNGSGTRYGGMRGQRPMLLLWIMCGWGKLIIWIYSTVLLPIKYGG